LSQIDWMGCTLVVTAVVCAVLGVSYGGVNYPWASPTVVILLVGAGVLLFLFIWAEYRAQQPIMALRLFAIRNVCISNVIAFVIGVVMFGTLSYLPVYFQEVHGDSPTISGLKLIPMMFGIITMSMISGAVMTKKGHFWAFPIIGNCLILLACALIGAFLTVDLNIGVLSVFIAILGLGIGSCVQSLIVIVQAGVERRDMAIGTAANTFLRQMGGVVGVAIYGTVLNNKLSGSIEPNLLGLALAGYDKFYPTLQNDPTALNNVLEGYTSAIQLVFYSTIPPCAIGVLLALALKNYTLVAAAGKPPAHGGEAAI